MALRPRLNLVVAVAENGGIGYKGSLPWRLRKDMAFFKKITSDVPELGKQNAVLMGRKTWDSIPEKFKPLANRINIIISTSIETAPKGTHVARSLEDCFQILNNPKIADKLSEVFVIGGSQIYQSVFELSEQEIRVYYTRVLKSFDCDVFFPSLDMTRFTKIKLENISSDVLEEEGIQYQFEVYDNFVTES